MLPNIKLSEAAQIVRCLKATVPSTSTPTRVSLRGAHRVSFIILVTNGSGTPVGSAITLKQSKTVAGGSEKALAFTNVDRNIDLSVNDLLTASAVTSNTFTTDATASKDAIYVIDVPAESLDINNGFDVVGVGTGDATGATVTVIAILNAKQGKFPQDSAIID